MNKKIKNNSGITLTTLIITIIVILILATVSVNVGKDLIKKSKVQTLETNMLIIQAKSKSYAEEVESKIWTKSEESEKDEARDEEFVGDENTSEEKLFSKESSINNEILDKVSDSIKSSYVAYKVKDSTLENWGLNESSSEEYIVIFSKNDYKQMDVIYTGGITYDGEQYYTLSAIQEKLENE